MSNSKQYVPTLAELTGRASEIMLENGLVVPDYIKTDKWDRCGTIEYPTDKDGEYIIHTDYNPIPVVTFCNHSGSGDGAYYTKSLLKNDEGKYLSTKDKARLKKEADERRKIFEENQRKEFESFKKERDFRLKKAKSIDGSEKYIIHKEIQVCDDVYVEKNGDLLVLYRDKDGNVPYVQVIPKTGKKHCITGSRKKNARFKFDDIEANNSNVFLVEGFADANTVHEATCAKTFGCIDCHNMPKIGVDLFLEGEFDGRIVQIVADNDPPNENYPEGAGKTAALATIAAIHKAAEETGKTPPLCVYCLGSDGGEHGKDINDYFCAKLAEARSNPDVQIPRDMALAAVRDRLLQVITPPQKSSTTPPMQFLSFSEVLNLKVPAELMKGLIPAVGVGYLYGDTGTFKTFIAIMIGYHIVEGLPLCGRKVKQRPVYYLLLEGAGSSPKRFRALDLWHHNNGNENPISNNYKFWMHNFSLTDTKQVDDLIATINVANNKGALIIIDTQSQASIGADENSAKDMTVILGNAKRISDDTNSVVMLIHHTGKDASRAHRGSSAQKANVDFSIKTVKGADGKSIQLVSDKERDEEKDQTVQFEIKIQDVGYDEDGEPITSCVAVPVCGDKKFTPALNIQGALKDKLDTFKDILKEYNKESITYSEWKDGIFKRNPHKTEGANNSDLSRSKGDLVKNELVSTDGVNFWLSEKARQL